MGLNRTMQYGNKKMKNYHNIQMSFKSYYVVWKLFRQGESIYDVASLNRTMQYGNSGAAQKLFADRMV